MDVATTFEVDCYELGLDVPLADRYVAVDIVRGEGAVTVSVIGRTEWWVLKHRQGRVVDQRRKDVETGKGEGVARVPRWVDVVLRHVGVVT